MRKDNSSLPNGADDENNNVEELETWEPLRIIYKDTHANLFNVEVVETWELFRIIKDIDNRASEEDTSEQG